MELEQAGLAERLQRALEALPIEQRTVFALYANGDMTYGEIAETLGIQQATVAKYERQSDLLLSTLRRYVAAMGGELKLMVEFPGKAPVVLEGLGDTEELYHRRRTTKEEGHNEARA